MKEINALVKVWIIDAEILRSFAWNAYGVASVSSIISLFLISPELLEASGYHYLTSGGSIFQKFHPGTWAALVALMLRCATSRRPIPYIWLLVSKDVGAFLFLIAILLTIMHALLISNLPVTPLVDTFILPFIVYLLLRDLSPAHKKFTAVCLSIVFCMNAVMAFAEVWQGSHFLTFDLPANVSSDPLKADAAFDWRAQLASDWRAMALLGHPLVNGMLVGGWIICLVSPGANGIAMPVRWALVLLQFASMFTFGARAALVVTLVISLILAVRASIRAVIKGVCLAPHMILFLMLGISILICAPTAAYQSGLLDRTLDRFQHDDGSAITRVAMFDMFDGIPGADILLGPDQDVAATKQRINGLEFGIESSWIGLLVKYGLILTVIIMIGILFFTLSIIRICAPGAIAVFILWYILVSGSTALSSKTTSFAMICALIMIFLRRRSTDTLNIADQTSIV